MENNFTFINEDQAVDIAGKLMAGTSRQHAYSGAAAARIMGMLQAKWSPTQLADAADKQDGYGDTWLFSADDGYGYTLYTRHGELHVGAQRGSAVQAFIRWVDTQ